MKTGVYGNVLVKAPYVYDSHLTIRTSFMFLSVMSFNSGLILHFIH